jgi:hypothetical protein
VTSPLSSSWATRCGSSPVAWGAGVDTVGTGAVADSESSAEAEVASAPRPGIARVSSSIPTERRSFCASFSALVGRRSPGRYAGSSSASAVASTS